MTTYRWWWGFTALALVGTGLIAALARLGAAQVVAIGLPMAGIGALYAYLYTPEGTEVSVDWICTWGLRTGLGVPAAVGLLGVLGPASLVPLLLFLGAAPASLEWFQRRYGESASSWPSRPSFASRISDRDLALAWESSYLALQQATDVAAKTRIVRVRTALLDELERRTLPARRTRRWVASPDRLVAGRPMQRH
jgi:hypothetical protein